MKGENSATAPACPSALSDGADINVRTFRYEAAGDGATVTVVLTELAM